MTRLMNAGLIALLTTMLISCQGEQSEPVATLTPLPGMEDEVPELDESIRIRFVTTAGDFVVEVYPQAAPNAANRFLELVQSGFYDETPVSRVVPDFVAQFGINWRDEYREWEENTFEDDPSLFALARGTLAFAKAGTDTNSTQVFINYTENNRLAGPQLNFTAFGQVIEGMETVDSFIQVGISSDGLNQRRLWAEGADYLNSLATQPTMIESAQVITP